jgi:hypothetical protein
MLKLTKTVIESSSKLVQGVKYLQTSPLVENQLQAVPKPEQPTKVINPLKHDNFFQTNELVDLEELFK